MRLPIAWIIPCYNEEAAIAQVVSDIKKHCPEAGIFVFDNNSTDQTAAVAKSAGATVLHEARKGKGHVVRAMFEKVDADIYIMVDGDATYDIASWRKLVDPIAEHRADMTVATRLKQYNDQSFRRFHVFGNHLIKGLINLIYDAKLDDVLSGFRGFSRRFVKGIPLGAKGFEVETELTINSLEHHFSIVEVTCPYYDRPEGGESKLNTFQDGALIIFTILRLVKDHKPLTVFGLLALFCFLTGTIISIVSEPGAISFALLGTGICSLFTGIILTTIAQRVKELAQLIRKID